MQINTNEWFVFDPDNSVGKIDKKVHNKIIRWANKKWEPSSVDIKKGITDEERITGKKGEYKLDSKLRISDIAWCNEQWMYDLVWPFMVTANQESGWRYNIKAAESVQITRYKSGGFYTWHTDGRGDHLSTYNNTQNAFIHGMVRKLSMTVVLNANFEGGAFEFASYSKEKCIISSVDAPAGSVIIFPSHMEHRVTPVTKGTRYSLVIWFLGPPFV